MTEFLGLPNFFTQPTASLSVMMCVYYHVIVTNMGYIWAKNPIMMLWTNIGFKKKIFMKIEMYLFWVCFKVKKVAHICLWLILATIYRKWDDTTYTCT